MRHSQLEYLRNSPYFKEEIWHFAIVAEEKNISKAAEFIGISQPQLSKSINHLEDSLKSKLFVRKSRGVDLTNFGIALFENLSKIGHQFMNSDLELSQIKVGFHPSIAIQIVPTVIHPFIIKEENPRIDLQFATSLEITRRVVDLQIDFGFVINPQRNPDIVSKKLQQDKIIKCTSKTGNDSKVLYYNPAMIGIQRTLKKEKGLMQVPVSDYEVIAETIRMNPGSAGILPQRIAHRYGLAEKNSEAILTVDLSLIAHKDRLKNQKIKAIFNQFELAAKNIDI